MHFFFKNKTNVFTGTTEKQLLPISSLRAKKIGKDGNFSSFTFFRDWAGLKGN